MKSKYRIYINLPILGVLGSILFFLGTQTNNSHEFRTSRDASLSSYTTSSTTEDDINEFNYVSIKESIIHFLSPGNIFENSCAEIYLISQNINKYFPQRLNICSPNIDSFDNHLMKPLVVISKPLLDDGINKGYVKIFLPTQSKMLIYLAISLSIIFSIIIYIGYLNNKILNPTTLVEINRLNTEINRLNTDLSDLNNVKNRLDIKLKRLEFNSVSPDTTDNLKLLSFLMKILPKLPGRSLITDSLSIIETTDTANQIRFHYLDRNSRTISYSIKTFMSLIFNEVFVYVSESTAIRKVDIIEFGEILRENTQEFLVVKLPRKNHKIKISRKNLKSIRLILKNSQSHTEEVTNDSKLLQY